VADPGIPKRGCGTGGLGDGSHPSGVLGRSPGGGLGAKPTEATDIMLHAQLTTSENFNTTTYTTRQNRTNLAQEIKLVWSSQSELVNDFDRFDWRRSRMYVD